MSDKSHDWLMEFPDGLNNGETGDLGVEDKDSNYSTSALPSSGHDEALDNRDVRKAASNHLRKLAASADSKTVEKRLLKVAERLDSIGIRETSPSNADELYSTSVLELPGQEGEKANDHAQDALAGKLQVFDTTPSDNDGPKPRNSASKVAHPYSEFKTEVKDAVDQLGPAKYESKESDLHAWVKELKTLAREKTASKSEENAAPPNHGKEFFHSLKEKGRTGGRWAGGDWMAEYDQSQNSADWHVSVYEDSGNLLASRTYSFVLSKGREGKFNVGFSDSEAHDVIHYELEGKDLKPFVERKAKQMELNAKSLLNRATCA